MKIFKQTAKFLLIFLLIISWVFQYPPGQLWKNLGGRGIQEAKASAPGQYTTTALKVAPSAAAGVSVTPSGTAWANSGWVQVIASTPASIVVAGLVVGGGASAEFEFDIGKGAAGSETVVATISGNRESAASSPRWLPLPIPVDNIASGQRVAVRIRKAGTSTTAWTVKLVYYEKPISGSVATTPNPSLVAPSAAAGASVTLASTAWTNSSWTEVIASTGDAIVLGGITINPAATVEYEVDVGVGAAGSEVVVTTIRGRSATAGAPQTIILKPLLDNIPAGSRVAVRIRANTTTTTAWTVKLIYYNKTNLGVGTDALTTKPLKWSPTSAAGASVTISGTAWANSNWVQLIASAPANLAIAAVEFVPAAAVDFEIEFGIGAAGSEIPIGLVRGRVLSTTLGNIFTVNIAPLINSVPAGSRLAVRIRTSGTTTTAWLVSVGYYENTDTTNALNAPHSSLPFSANSATVTNSATAWANSSYVELTPGLEDDIYINRVIVGPSAASQFEIDIATGAAGSEVVQTTVAGQSVSNTGNSVIDLPAPLTVSANTRIAMRIRTSLTSAGTWNLALEYAPDEQMKQSAYRFFDNIDSTDVGTPLAAQDTAATLSSTGAAFRLRMLLHMTTNKLATLSAQSFKLQFAQRGSDNQCDSNFNGESYTDVTAATAIAYNDNPTPADGAALTANADDPSHGSDATSTQTYEELNNFTNSQSAIRADADGLWDFSLKDNGAATSTAYCLRAVKSDGSLLDTYSVIPQITTAAPAAPTTTLGSGTDPASQTIAPGAGATDIDAFTFQTDSGTDSITQVTTTFSADISAGVSEVQITNDAGTVIYGTSTLSGITASISLSGLTANTTQTQFKIRVVPKSHSAMPAPPGAEYTATATISAWTGTNTQAGSDTNANALTIDNLSPNGATATSTSAGDAQVTLNWTTSNSSDFSTSTVLRWTGSSPGSEVPAEGVEYTVGATIGTATVACVRGDAASTAVSGTDGAGTGGCSATPLTNGTTYSYKVFQKDSRGNWDVGVSMGSATPNVPTITISGFAYEDEGTTVWTGCAGGGAVGLRFNGATATTTCSNADGSFSFSPGTAGAGTPMVLWFDGLGTNVGSAINRYTGSGNSTGIIIRRNRVIIYHDDSGPTTNANMGIWDKDNDPDINYTVDASNVLTVDSGSKLIVAGSKTWTPGATSTLNGDLEIKAGATLSMGANALSVGGDFVNAGIFSCTAGSQTTTFTATTTGHVITSGTGNFCGVTFNGSGGGWSNSNAMTVQNALTITAGTLSQGNAAFTVSGTSSITGTLNTTGGATGTRTFTGAVTVNSGGTLNLSGQNPATSFGAGITQSSANLINLGTGSSTLVGNLSGAGTGGITWGGALTISSGTTNNNYTGGAVTVNGTLTLTGNWTQGASSSLTLGASTPFAGAGTFDASTNANTVTYSGASPTCKIVAYHHLTFSGSGTVTCAVTTVNGNLETGGTVSWTTSSDIVIGGSMTLNGTLFSGTNNITVNGGYVAGNGDINMTGGTFLVKGSGSVGSNTAWDFYNLSLGDGSTIAQTTGQGTMKINNDLVINSNHTFNAFFENNSINLEVVGDMTINGSYIASDGSGLWKVGGDFINAGTITHNNGSLELYGTTSSILNSGCTNFPDCTNQSFYNLIINKTSGLDANDNVSLDTRGLRVTNQITITDGELVQGAFNVWAGGFDPENTGVSISADGKWTNISTGDLILGGNFINDGTAIFNSNNGTQCVDGADDIVITSTASGEVRTWSGAGTFIIYNVAATDMADSGITAYTSTLTNTTWTVGSCGGEITIEGVIYKANKSTLATTGNGGPCNGSTPVISIRRNNGSASTGFCNGTTAAYNIILADPPSAGDTITIYLTSTMKANLVYVSDGTSDTGMDLYENTVVVGNNNGGSSTILDLVDYDSTTDDTNMLYDAVDTTVDSLTLEDGIELHIRNNFSPGGTITSPGGVYIASGATLSSSNDISTNGALRGDGTVYLTGGTALLDGAGKLGGNTAWTFNNLNLGVAATTLPSNPTSITTCTELQNMNNNRAGNYILANDINCSDTVNWNSGAGFLPVGTSGAPFTGKFDGQGYTISNLYINRPTTDNVGLFGLIYPGGVIRNVKLTNADVTAQTRSGVLLGVNIGGTVSNVYASGTITSTTDDYLYIGGLVGVNEGDDINNVGLITHSHADVDVIANAGTDTNRVGGLIGYLNAFGVYGAAVVRYSSASGDISGDYTVGGLVGDNINGGIIEYSYATGNVTGIGYTGGLLGTAHNGNVHYSYATGSVMCNGGGVGSNCGGLVGKNYGGTITNSYATGNVTSTGLSNTGGLVGGNEGASDILNSYATGNVSSNDYIVGGLVGLNTSYSTIVNSYSTGLVTASGFYGGMVGDNSSATCIGSFWDTQTSELTYSACGTGRTTAQMKDVNTFKSYLSNSLDWVDTDTDGIADNWMRNYDSENASIVTGNGFSGNAQRFVATQDGTAQAISNRSFAMIQGHTYHYSFKYRGSSGLVLFEGVTVAIEGVPSNTGDAVTWEGEYTAQYDGSGFNFFVQNTGEWWEIDEVEIYDMGLASSSAWNMATETNWTNELWTHDSGVTYPKLGLQHDYVSTGSGTVTVNGTMKIGLGEKLDAKGKTWTLNGTTGTPLVIDGTLDDSADNSTFVFAGVNGSGNTIIPASDGYHNLTISPASSETFVTTGNMSLSGTLSTNSNTTWNSSGDLSNNGSIIGSGNIYLGGIISGNGTVNMSGGNFKVGGVGSFGGNGNMTFNNLEFAANELAFVDAEENNTSDFNGGVVGNFTANAAAAKEGGYGYRMLFNGSTQTIIGQLDISPQTADTYIGGWLYIPSGYNFGANTQRYVMDMESSTWGGKSFMGFVTNASGVPIGWRLQVGPTLTYDDSTTNFSLDTWHYIELAWIKGTGANGGGKLWVDGDLAISILDTNGDGADIAHILVGAWGGSGNPANGAYVYWDSITVANSRVGGTNTANGSGNITVNNALTVGPYKTLDFKGKTWTFSGNVASPLVLNGTFSDSTNTSTLVFTGNNGAGNTTIPASTSYHNLIFNGGDTYEAAGAITLSGDLTVTAGTLSSSNDITVSGGDVTGNGLINQTAGTFTVQGSGTFGGDTAWAFNNLVFGNGTSTAGTTASGSGSVTSATLTINSNHELYGASKEWILTGSGTPLVVNGTFTPASSTISYRGEGSVNIPNMAYYNLDFKPASGNPTYILPSGTLDVTNNFIVGDGLNAVTVTANNNDGPININGSLTIANDSVFTASDSGLLTVRGNWINNGTFNNSGGTVKIQPYTETPVVIGGSSPTTFHHFQSSPTANSQNITLQFKAGQSTGFAGTLTLNGQLGKPIYIQSDSFGSQWTFNLTGIGNVNYAVIRDSACAGNDIVQSQSNLDYGNNGSCWKFVSRGAPAGTSGGGTGIEGGGAGGGTGGVSCDGVSGLCDDFERSSLGSNWTVAAGTPQIYSNSDFGGGSSDIYNLAYWTGSTLSNDQYSEAILSALPAGHQVLVAVRVVNASNFYAIRATTTSFEIIKVVSGTPTTLLNLGSPYPTETSIIRLEVSETTLKAYINGVLRNQTTDSSLASGAPGIAVYASGVQPSSAIELWSASNAAQTGGGSGGGGGGATP